LSNGTDAWPSCRRARIGSSQPPSLNRDDRHARPRPDGGRQEPRADRCGRRVAELRVLARQVERPFAPRATTSFLVPARNSSSSANEGSRRRSCRRSVGSGRRGRAGFAAVVERVSSRPRALGSRRAPGSGIVRVVGTTTARTSAPSKFGPPERGHARDREVLRAAVDGPSSATRALAANRAEARVGSSRTPALRPGCGAWLGHSCSFSGAVVSPGPWRTSGRARALSPTVAGGSCACEKTSGDTRLDLANLPLISLGSSGLGSNVSYGNRPAVHPDQDALVARPERPSPVEAMLSGGSRRSGPPRWSRPQAPAQAVATRPPLAFVWILITISLENDSGELGGSGPKVAIA